MLNFQWPTLLKSNSMKDNFKDKDLEQIRIEFHQAIEDLIIKMQNFMNYLDSKKEVKE